MLTNRFAWLLLSGMAVVMAACQSGSDEPRKKDKSGTGGTGKGKTAVAAGDDNIADQANAAGNDGSSHQKIGAKNSASADATGKDDGKATKPTAGLSANTDDDNDPSSAADRKIPPLTCSGSGTIHNTFGDFDWHRTDVAGGTTAELSSTTTDVGSSDGDVNDSVQGMKRTVKYTLLAAKDSGLAVDQRFLMVSRQWDGVTVDKPIPVSLYPSHTGDRYAALKKGPLAFSASGNAGGTPFTVNATVTLQSMTGDAAVIQFAYDVPGADGATWEKIGLPANATVTIDFNTGKMASITSTSYYHNSHTPCADMPAGFPGGFGPCAEEKFSELQRMDLAQQCQ